MSLNFLNCWKNNAVASNSFMFQKHMAIYNNLYFMDVMNSDYHIGPLDKMAEILQTIFWMHCCDWKFMNFD